MAVVNPERSSPPQLLQQRVPARWTVFSTAVLFLLLVSLWLRFSSPNRGEPLRAAVRPSSVAVLPFINTSPDAADDYLGAGLAAELTRGFKRLTGLQVSSRSSAFAPRQVTGDPRIAGRRMGVATVLLGTIRRSGDRLRVTTRLVDVEQGFDVWSETYERETRELFEIEDEIRDAVAGALRVTSTADSTTRRRPTASFPAYDAYLAGRYQLEQLTSGSTRRAVAHFTHAVRLDSTFARAHAALAEAYMRHGGVEAMSPLTAVPLARAAANRALELDSMLAEAHATLGTIAFGFDRNWRRAEADFRRAVALEPGASELYQPYSRFLLAMGRIDGSRAASERALQLSPLSPGLTHHLGWHYLHARQYDRARETLQRALELDSTAWRVHFDLALLEQASRNYPAAETHIGMALATVPHRAEVQAALGQLYALSGRTEDAKTVLGQLQAASTDRYVSPHLIAAVEAALGQRTQVFASLD